MMSAAHLDDDIQIIMTGKLQRGSTNVKCLGGIQGIVYVQMLELTTTHPRCGTVPAPNAVDVWAGLVGRSAGENVETSPSSMVSFNTFCTRMMCIAVC